MRRTPKSVQMVLAKWLRGQDRASLLRVVLILKWPLSLESLLWSWSALRPACLHHIPCDVCPERERQMNLPKERPPEIAANRQKIGQIFTENIGFSFLCLFYPAFWISGFFLFCSWPRFVKHKHKSLQIFLVGDPSSDRRLVVRALSGQRSDVYVLSWEQQAHKPLRLPRHPAGRISDWRHQIKPYVPTFIMCQNFLVNRELPNALPGLCLKVLEEGFDKRPSWQQVPHEKIPNPRMADSVLLWFAHGAAQAVPGERDSSVFRYSFEWKNGSDGSVPEPPCNPLLTA